MATLSAEEIGAYRDEGLVVPQFHLPTDLFAELRDDCERLIRENPEIRPEQLISAHLEKRPGRTEGLRGGGRILRYATHPDILDLVELLIATVHRIDARAHRKVTDELVNAFRRVDGKENLLFAIAEAALAEPGGTVREVVYPAVRGFPP